MNLQTKLDNMVTVNHSTLQAELEAMLKDGKELYNTIQKMPLRITPNLEGFRGTILDMYHGHGIDHILIRQRT